jgi:hypothetical protein
VAGLVPATPIILLVAFLFRIAGTGGDADGVIQDDQNLRPRAFPGSAFTAMTWIVPSVLGAGDFQSKPECLHEHTLLFLFFGSPSVQARLKIQFGKQIWSRSRN